LTVVIRAAKPADYAYCVDTWVESSRPSGITPAAWRSAVIEGIAADVRRHKLAVACDEDDAERLYGWACGSAGRVLYVYLTSTRRRMGLGGRLVAEVAGKPTSTAWLTPPAQSWAARHGVVWKR
jgi:hypothetical protein